MWKNVAFELLTMFIVLKNNINNIKKHGKKFNVRSHVTQELQELEFLIYHTCYAELKSTLSLFYHS